MKLLTFDEFLNESALTEKALISKLNREDMASITSKIESIIKKHNPKGVSAHPIQNAKYTHQIDFIDSSISSDALLKDLADHGAKSFNLNIPTSQNKMPLKYCQFDASKMA